MSQIQRQSEIEGFMLRKPNISQKIAFYLHVATTDIIEIQEWAYVYWLRIRGMRPTFVTKKLSIPAVSIPLLLQLHSSLNFERDLAKEEIEKIAADHKQLRAMALRRGWSFKADEFGWKIQGIHAGFYYYGSERDIEKRLQSQKRELLPKIKVGDIIETHYGNAQLVLDVQENNVYTRRFFFTPGGAFKSAVCYRHEVANVTLAKEAVALTIKAQIQRLGRKYLFV